MNETVHTAAYTMSNDGLSRAHISTEGSFCPGHAANLGKRKEIPAQWESPTQALDR